LVALPLLDVAAPALVPTFARADDQGEWAAFKARHVALDGRVIDNGNAGVSHSEGQGWGMLLSVAFDDVETFRRIQAWTRRVLWNPKTGLHAWRFVPDAHPAVADPNNATDGDLFIGAALARAGMRWHDAACVRDAADMARALLAHVVCEVGHRIFLLPGMHGFHRHDSVVLNPSYYAFPMIAELARIVPDRRWGQLVANGQALIEHGRFGTWELPPDWLEIPEAGAAPSPATGWPARFGFDAVRVPMWCIWQNLPPLAAVAAADRFWSTYPNDAEPAWVDLVSGAVSPYRAPPGIVAVARLTHAELTGGTPVFPRLAEAGDYYNACLIMLSRLAWQERTGKAH
jgi:endoglucanase